MSFLNCMLDFYTCSTFHNHLRYKLSEEEANKLLEKKWNYKWESEVSNCKWRGTGECFLKVSLSCLAYNYMPPSPLNWYISWDTILALFIYVWL